MTSIINLQSVERTKKIGSGEKTYTQYTLTTPNDLIEILKWEKGQSLIIELTNDRTGIIITKKNGVKK